MYIEEGWAKANKTLDGLKVDQLQFLQSPELGKYITLPLKYNDLQVKVQQESLHHVSLPTTPLKILEIGGGIGNFAEHMFRNFGVGSYTIIDTPTMLRFSQAFLKKRADKCSFVTTDKYYELKRQKFDLTVSCACLSEIPDNHRKNLLKLVLETSAVTYLVDSSSVFFRCIEHYDDLEYEYWVNKELEARYKDVLKLLVPFPSYNHCQRIYIGTNRDVDSLIKYGHPSGSVAGLTPNTRVLTTFQWTQGG